MSKKQRPKDANQWAKSIVDQATSQDEDTDKAKKRPAKVRKLKPRSK
jgi:hypothetical protein